ncbi:MAG: lysozyme inhibitor LprI family protein [Holosporales bacterium]
MLILVVSNVAYAENEKSFGQQVIEKCWKKNTDHVAAVECESKVLDTIKQEMQSLYEKVRADARIMDEENKKIGSASVDIEETVINSQKAFEAYQDAECSRLAAYVMGGTYAADTSIGCELNLVQQRINHLKIRDL